MITELFSVTEADVGRVISDFTHRLQRDGVETVAREVLRTLVPVESEVQDRNGLWFLMRVRPYRTVEDRIDGVVLTFVDITERLEMERQLLESKQRYQMLFNSIDEGFCVLDVVMDDVGTPIDYRSVEVNTAFQKQTGLHDAEGKTISELVPGQDEAWDPWVKNYGRIAATQVAERFELEAVPLDRFYEVFAFPIEGKNLLGVLFRDIKARKEAETHREMLTLELSHRVKNSLAVVKALARKPIAADLTAKEYRERFVGRIQALALAHDQLLETSWRSADLGVLAEATLKPYRTRRRELEINGPNVTLAPKQGVGMALILHELATNAVKYGSLSVEEGNLIVSWDLVRRPDGAKSVRMSWMEREGPEIGSPAADGFGTKLIQRTVAYELDGTVELSFGPEGLTVKLEFPQTQGDR